LGHGRQARQLRDALGAGRGERAKFAALDQPGKCLSLSVAVYSNPIATKGFLLYLSVLVNGCLPLYIGHLLVHARACPTITVRAGRHSGKLGEILDMARRVLDKRLDSRDARRRLKIRGKPYYRTIERGLHLGYRRLGDGQAGTWVARHYIGEQQYEVERIGAADDKSDADGTAILNFWQAQDKARKAMVERAHVRH